MTVKTAAHAMRHKPKSVGNSLRSSSGDSVGFFARKLAVDDNDITFVLSIEM